MPLLIPLREPVRGGRRMFALFLEKPCPALNKRALDSGATCKAPRRHPTERRTTPIPARLTQQYSAQSHAAQATTELLERCPQAPRKPDVTTGPGTAKFFFAKAILMALAPLCAARGSAGCPFSAPLPISSSLGAAARTPCLATPIAACRTPPRPAPRRLDARRATIPR